MKRMRISVPFIAMIGVLLIGGAVFGAVELTASGRGQQAPQFGPPNGSLVIVGGAMRDPAILDRFLQLAGGPDAPIVVIPTAGGGAEYDEWNSGVQAWKRAGATDITVLHTVDSAEADTDAFVAPLKRARGVLVRRRSAMASRRFLSGHQDPS